MKVIDLHKCDKITDEGLKHLKGVKNINLSCKITDEGLKYLTGVKYIN